MVHTFLKTRPLLYLTISLIKVAMDNSDKVTSSCLYYISSCRLSKSQRDGIHWLLTPNNITEDRVGKRSKDLLEQLWTKIWFFTNLKIREWRWPLPHPQISLCYRKYLSKITKCTFNTLCINLEDVIFINTHTHTRTWHIANSIKINTLMILKKKISNF